MNKDCIIILYVIKFCNNKLHLTTYKASLMFCIVLYIRSTCYLSTCFYYTILRNAYDTM